MSKFSLEKLGNGAQVSTGPHAIFGPDRTVTVGIITNKSQA